MTKAAWCGLLGMQTPLNITPVLVSAAVAGGTARSTSTSKGGVYQRAMALCLILPLRPLSSGPNLCAMSNVMKVGGASATNASLRGGVQYSCPRCACVQSHAHSVRFPVCVCFFGHAARKPTFVELAPASPTSLASFTSDGHRQRAPSPPLVRAAHPECGAGPGKPALECALL